jgi:Fic family protein
MELVRPPCTHANVKQLLFGGSVQRPDGKSEKLVFEPTMLDGRPQLLREYRPWRKFRHIARDAGADPEKAWVVAKVVYMSSMQQVLPLFQTSGEPFWLGNIPQLHEGLHRIDRALGGGEPVALDPEGGILGDADQQRRFRIRTLMDEAAESSLIEGASGTRKQATDLLRSGRQPVARGERMIVNNYITMQRIKELLDQPLSVDMLCELQQMLTEGTLDNPGEAGRLRMPEERVRVVDERDNSDLYIPPPAESLPARLRSLCDFANRDHSRKDFIHPIVKAAILHFMIGYEHPFCDGNGRTARAVFYWFALKERYPIFEFLSISDRIRAGVARYPQAYLDTELEGGDLTHFVLYKLDIIEQALDQFAIHLANEEAKLKRSQALGGVAAPLNLRQRILLDHALRNPLAQYTVRSHANSNGINVKSARADLQRLVELKLLATTKNAQEVVYLPAPDLAKKLSKRSVKRKSS